MSSEQEKRLEELVAFAYGETEGMKIPRRYIGLFQEASAPVKEYFIQLIKLGTKLNLFGSDVEKAFPKVELIGKSIIKAISWSTESAFLVGFVYAKKYAGDSSSSQIASNHLEEAKEHLFDSAIPIQKIVVDTISGIVVLTKMSEEQGKEIMKELNNLILKLMTECFQLGYEYFYSQ